MKINSAGKSCVWRAGVWKFILLEKIGNRYLWDKRPCYYFIEWWEGKKRPREVAGQTSVRLVISLVSLARIFKRNEWASQWGGDLKNYWHLARG